MNQHIKSGRPFRISYTFDAPREDVFAAFSTAEALAEWWGPAEMKNTVISLDFRPGGTFHFKMEGEGFVSYGRFLFRNIVPNELLEFNNAFADEHANVVPAPFDENFPREIFYSLLFTEANDKTAIFLSGEPVKADDAGHTAFAQLDSSMEQGFGATFKKLSEYLNKR